MPVVSTGPTGGLLFGFHYLPDAIGLLSKPRRYQHCEVAYGEADIADGVVADVNDHEEEDGWMLLISIGPEHAREVADAINSGAGVAVRVLG